MHGLSKKSRSNRPPAGTQNKTQKTFGPEIVKLKLIITVSLIFLDQISKLLSIKFLNAVSNSGIAFGIGENIPLWLVIGFFLAVVFVAYRDRFKTGEIIFLAGGAGNILDRLMYGKIVDWIKFGSLWFNLADIYIVSGIILMFSHFVIPADAGIYLNRFRVPPSLTVRLQELFVHGSRSAFRRAGKHGMTMKKKT